MINKKTTETEKVNAWLFPDSKELYPVPVGTGPVRIGYNPLKCDLVISSPDMDAVQAELRFENGELLLENRGSNHNTRLSTAPVETGKTVPLFHDDEVFFGALSVRILRTDRKQRSKPIATVEFQAENGWSERIKVEIGAQIKKPQAPEKPADESFDYKFKEWSFLSGQKPGDDDRCRGDAVFQAVYEAYGMITFLGSDGHEIGHSRFRAGDIITFPSLEGDPVVWESKMGKQAGTGAVCRGNATFTAVKKGQQTVQAVMMLLRLPIGKDSFPISVSGSEDLIIGNTDNCGLRIPEAPLGTVCAVISSPSCKIQAKSNHCIQVNDTLGGLDQRTELFDGDTLSVFGVDYKVVRSHKPRTEKVIWDTGTLKIDFALLQIFPKDQPLPTVITEGFTIGAVGCSLSAAGVPENAVCARINRFSGCVEALAESCVQINSAFLRRSEPHELFDGDILTVGKSTYSVIRSGFIRMRPRLMLNLSSTKQLWLLPDLDNGSGGIQTVLLGRNHQNSLNNSSSKEDWWSEFVSRNHGQLEVEGSRIYFRDTNSTNGTRINNTILLKSGERAEIHSGDVLKLGLFDECTFQVSEPQSDHS